MSFLDLYQGDQEQAARIQPNEGHDLPSGFDENFHAAWSDGRLFSQSIAQINARGAALDDYADEVKSKTGFDLKNDLAPKEGGGPIDYDAVNFKIAALNQQNPNLNIAPLNDDEIDKRALVKAQAAHRNYQAMQAGERTAGGAFGSFVGSAASSAADPINIAGLAIAPETAGIGILSAALRWGAVAGVSQAAIEFASDDFRNQVQPGYTESGEPIKEISGAFVGGAVLGGITKALGSAWTKVKTGQWPTSVRDAGNVVESEAHTASTNPLPGAEGEVAHREALTKSIDDILAERPVDVNDQITPEMAAHFDAWHGSPHDFERFDSSKIDTGEGMQAYGHGLYFAENAKVAADYADRLGKSNISNEDLISGNYEIGPNGSVYKVRITADKEKFLDHDKTMAEQSPYVREVMSALGIPEEVNFPKLSNRIGADAIDEMKPLTGADAYRRLGVKVGPREMDDTVGREAAASKALSEAGIPGIKYFDQGSRGKGKGSQNYVVFDDAHIQITHKNGKPVNAEIRQGVIDQAAGFPPKEPELPLDAPATAPAPVGEPGPQPALHTPEQIAETLTAPDHQDVIRGDIDRAIDANAAEGKADIKVPGIDEMGNHTMVSVHSAVDEVDAYRKLATDIQACAVQQEAAE